MKSLSPHFASDENRYHEQASDRGMQGIIFSVVRFYASIK